MSQVQDCVECRQCGYDYADYIYDCRLSSEWLSCSHCGYLYESGPVYDRETREVVLNGDGKWVWQTNERKGYGALCYRMKGAIGWCVQSLDEDCAERLKREVETAIQAGEFEETPFYLTRWNEEARRVDVLLGNLPPAPDFDSCGSEPQAVSVHDNDAAVPPEEELPF